MRRSVVVIALLASAAIHAAIAPEHLAEMQALGTGFVASAAIAVVLAAWIMDGRHVSAAFTAACVLFAAMLAAWALAVTSGIPVLMDEAEPVELTAVLCKLIEVVGLVVAASPTLRRTISVVGSCLLVPCLLVLLGIPGPVGAANVAMREVAIPAKAFEPDHLEVLVGDTVAWRNSDAVTHTVTADDGSFDSREVGPGDTFSVTFDRPGRVTYHCAIHRYMTGEVDAFALALTAPRDPVTVGTDVSLSGIAAPGTELVAVQRRGADGAFATAATAAPSADGRFQATVPAVTSADYRAVAGPVESPLVRVAVAPRITLAVRPVARRVQLIGSASPPQKGLPGVLQLYSRERFTWVRYVGFRFDAHSQIRITLSTRRALRLRLVLLRATTGFVGGTSNTVSLTRRRNENLR